jgi:hypothetical protein
MCKQSQSRAASDWRPVVQTKPIPGSGGDLGWILPNKPNFRRARCRCWSIAPNKANSGCYADPEIGVPGRANCAKQSQTWTNWGIWGMTHRGVYCAKRSQLPEAGHRGDVRPSGRRERSGIHHSTPATRAAAGDCFFPPGGYSVPYSMGPSPSHELRRAT